MEASLNGVTTLKASILGYGGQGTTLAQELILAAAGTSEIGAGGILNGAVMTMLTGTLNTGDPTRPLAGRVPVTLIDGTTDTCYP